MSILGEIIAGALQAAVEAAATAAFDRVRAAPSRATPPRLPTEPTAFESMAMAFGGLGIFLAVVFLCIFLHQWSLERLVRREAPASAVIVSIDRKQTGFTDIRLDYDRQTPFGSIACRNAPARIRDGSQNLEAGRRIEVYSQPGSCSQPIYAPDIGNPRASLRASATAFPIGIAMLFVGYAAFRGRQYRLATTARTAKHGTRLSGLGT
jgi:hypothetical protein